MPIKHWVELHSFYVSFPGTSPLFPQICSSVWTVAVTQLMHAGRSWPAHTHTPDSACCIIMLPCCGFAFCFFFPRLNSLFFHVVDLGTLGAPWEEGHASSPLVLLNSSNLLLLCCSDTKANPGGAEVSETEGRVDFVLTGDFFVALLQNIVLPLEGSATEKQSVLSTEIWKCD